MIDLFNYYNNEFFPFPTPPFALTILNMGLIWINMAIRKDKIANWFIGIMVVLSFIPLINALALLSFTFYIIGCPNSDNWFFARKENKLKEMNRLIQCNHCDVMFRKGYMKKEKECPICENYNSFFKEVKNQNLYDKKIPEQAKIKNSYKKNNEQLIKEQNELYIKAKEEKLINKNRKGE